ncbi:MAG: TSUP family transporter [Oscillospiraceae bacterium]
MKRFFEGMLCGLMNGFFGSGGGVVAVPLLERELRAQDPDIPDGDAARRSHADSVALILALSAVAAASYLFSGGIDLSAAWGYIPFGAAGAAAGALLLRKIKAPWLHKLFGALICAAAVRTLLS